MLCHCIIFICSSFDVTVGAGNMQFVQNFLACWGQICDTGQH